MMTYEEAVARCWAEIDLDTVCNNYRTACALAKDAQVICVLKGNAYGLGAVPVCRALMECGAKIFAVASGDEAEQLLRACPNADVLILGLVGRTQAARLIRLGALFTLFSSEYGQTLRAAAQEAGQPARVHIKADTGLFRLGFSGESAADEIAALHATGYFQMEGLFTHLALHNRETDAAQFALLDSLRDALRARGIDPPCVHAADSIGMVRYPKRHMDAVRVGAWLYGVRPNECPSPDLCRLPVQFKARIAQIHDVPAGNMIGYDDDHFLARDSRIATLTCGYLDGVARLNNAGEVLIRGRRAPVKGLVCMDQMMVDVTDIPDAAAGDVVTLLGGDIGVNEYAAWGRLNRNEALGRIGRRVTRVYRLNGAQWFENDITVNEAQNP